MGAAALRHHLAGALKQRGGSGQGFHSALLALQNSNYVVGVLEATNTTVPDDAAAVVLTAADKPLLDTQKQAYAAYLAKGGKMLITSAGRALACVRRVE